MVLSNNIVELSKMELLEIDGGVNWWQVGEAVVLGAAAAGAYATAAFLTPTVVGAAGMAAVGCGLQVAAYSTLAGAFVD